MHSQKLTIDFTHPEHWECFNPPIITGLQKVFMAVYPDLILQYAHKLRDELKKAGVEKPVVKIQSYKSLNGRETAPLIDPDVNLAEVTYPSWGLRSLGSFHTRKNSRPA